MSKQPLLKCNIEQLRDIHEDFSEVFLGFCKHITHIEILNKEHLVIGIHKILNDNDIMCLYQHIYPHNTSKYIEGKNIAIYHNFANNTYSLPLENGAIYIVFLNPFLSTGEPKNILYCNQETADKYFTELIVLNNV